MKEIIQMARGTREWGVGEVKKGKREYKEKWK